MTETSNIKREDINIRHIIHQMIEVCTDARLTGDPIIFRSAVENFAAVMCPYHDGIYKKFLKGHVQLVATLEVLRTKKEISKMFSWNKNALLWHTNSNLIIDHEAKTFSQLIKLAHRKNLLLTSRTTSEMEDLSEDEEL